MDENIKGILESLDFIKDNMVTKDELNEGLAGLREEMETGFSELRGEIKELRAESLAIVRKLDALSETVDGMKGYATEIDELRSRVNALELKLEKATA